MIKIISAGCFMLFTCTTAIAQNIGEAARLKLLLTTTSADSSRVLLLDDLCAAYRSFNTDTSLLYGQAGLELAEKSHFLRGKAATLNELGSTLRITGNIPKSLELQFRALQIARENNFHAELFLCLRGIGVIYLHELDDYPMAISYFLKQLKLMSDFPKERYYARGITYLNLGIAYHRNNQLDSSLFYLQKTLEDSVDKRTRNIRYVVLYYYGDLQFQRGNQALAFESLRKSISIIQTENKDSRARAEAYTIMARLFKETAQPDSASFYAKLGIGEASAIGYKRKVLENALLLSGIYEAGDTKQAYHYLQLAHSINNELFGSKKIQDLQRAISEEQERQRQAEAKQTAYQNKLKQYAFLAGLTILLVIASILYGNNKQKQKANSLLLLQKEEINNALTRLKSTQSQLIQSEKMASLGELTAGIAHEIQNPLNFVNNFSEVNKEMLEELKAERLKPNAERDDDLQNELINDVVANEEKINHHGKRADAIVKGMLQHSRSSTGAKEPTDINALADEYLRLSYHGLRAKDKDFNATVKTDFDEGIGKVNIVPQDIGRVLLNLYNNAFYAVNEKRKEIATAYEALITVSTKMNAGKIEIKVTDNGTGIPQKVVDKIFQPFFTTKPTGQGTGLGLSLSYDIIKAHGGEIKVETNEGEGSEFIIQLPVG